MKERKRLLGMCFLGEFAWVAEVKEDWVRTWHRNGVLGDQLELNVYKLGDHVRLSLETEAAVWSLKILREG